MSGPITFRRDGDTLIPLGVGMLKRFDDDYVDGEIYRMVELEERSAKTHAHYFATLGDMFASLPQEVRANEEWAESAEHMRKWALIKTGFREVVDYPCETRAEAKRWAARIKVKDDYAIILTEGNIVRVMTAKSQSHKAMPTKGEFQRSKEAVLNFLADLLKLPKDADQRNTQ